MKIGGFIWLDQIVDKLISKHGVETYEVEEVFDENPKVRFVEKGDRKDEDVYMASGQSVAGRYLVVLFIRKRNGEALVLSARDMEPRERRMYERK